MLWRNCAGNLPDSFALAAGAPNAEVSGACTSKLYEGASKGFCIRRGDGPDR
jgi:hypothetical protein